MYIRVCNICSRTQQMSTVLTDACCSVRQTSHHKNMMAMHSMLAHVGRDQGLALDQAVKSHLSLCY